MHITFANKQARDTFESGQVAATKFGADAAQDLQRLMADIEAASTLQEMPYGPDLFQEQCGSFWIGGLSVDFKVQGRDRSGAITAIRIEGIGDAK